MQGEDEASLVGDIEARTDVDTAGDSLALLVAELLEVDVAVDDADAVVELELLPVLVALAEEELVAVDTAVDVDVAEDEPERVFVVDPESELVGVGDCVCVGVAVGVSDAETPSVRDEVGVDVGEAESVVVEEGVGVLDALDDADPEVEASTDSTLLAENDDTTLALITRLLTALGDREDRDEGEGRAVDGPLARGVALRKDCVVTDANALRTGDADALAKALAKEEDVGRCVRDATWLIVDPVDLEDDEAADGDSGGNGVGEADGVRVFVAVGEGEGEMVTEADLVTDGVVDLEGVGVAVHEPAEDRPVVGHADAPQGQAVGEVAPGGQNEPMGHITIFSAAVPPHHEPPVQGAHTLPAVR